MGENTRRILDKDIDISKQEKYRGDLPKGTFSYLAYSSLDDFLNEIDENPREYLQKQLEKDAPKASIAFKNRILENPPTLPDSKYPNVFTSERKVNDELTIRDSYHPINKWGATEVLVKDHKGNPTVVSKVNWGEAGANYVPMYTSEFPIPVMSDSELQQGYYAKNKRAKGGMEWLHTKSGLPKEIKEKISQGLKKEKVSTPAELLMRDMVTDKSFIPPKPFYGGVTSEGSKLENILYNKEIANRFKTIGSKALRASPWIGSALALASGDVMGALPGVGDILSSEDVGPLKGSEDYNMENPKRKK